MNFFTRFQRLLLYLMIQIIIKNDYKAIRTVINTLITQKLPKRLKKFMNLFKSSQIFLSNLMLHEAIVKQLGHFKRVNNSKITKKSKKFQ